ncbi:putative transcriptional regulator [Pseudomonas sp. M47T1]|uniref:LysR family transcriptional regulator n=1 Tax=Pseudomonas sp. M47T1 TaxID=1179778 RepID=UPI0002608863|nr:LysR family transcriptional regulator [Pseudomonas sp. M47T1]EIK95432.1 putative transcriptional regulator [Pseudomonas sp. M47T1]
MDTLQNMRTFVCVAESGSFSHAAKQLNVAVATVSRSVAALEAHLRARLLNRSTRHVALTEVGQRYLVRCEQIIAHVDEVEAGNTQLRPSGRLRVHSMMGVGRHYVVPAIADYRQQYPDVSFELTMANRMPDLIEEGIDVAIVLAPQLPDSGYVSQRIGQSYSVLCASPDYIARHGAPATPQALREHECLRLVSPSSSVDQWEFYGHDEVQRVSLRPSAFQVNMGDAMIEAIESGMGVGSLPVFSAQRGIDSGSLVRLLPQYHLQCLNVYAVYTNRRYLDAKIKVLISHLRTVLPGGEASI